MPFRSQLVSSRLIVACCLIVALAGDGRGQDDSIRKAPDGTAWSRLMSAKEVQAEIAAIRTRLSEKLQTVGTYNRSYLEIPADAASLSLLGFVAAQHEGDIPWKNNARSITALAGQIVEVATSSSARGRKSQKTNAERLVMIEKLLEGQTQAANVEANDTRLDYSEFAPYEHLMKRNDNAYRRLKSALQKPDDFASKAEQTTRELKLMALNASVLTAGDYGYEDDDEFAGYAASLRDGAIAAAEAAQAGNLKLLKQRTELMMKSCTQCHASYR